MKEGMFDTKRFELTPEEIPSFEAGYQYAIAKVLSLFEPVELEALGEQDLIDAYVSWADLDHENDYQMDGFKEISQRTINKNQKRQLYRIREG